MLVQGFQLCQITWLICIDRYTGKLLQLFLTERFSCIVPSLELPGLYIFCHLELLDFDSFYVWYDLQIQRSIFNFQLMNIITGIGLYQFSYHVYCII